MSEYDARSRANSREYEDNYDRIFGKKPAPPDSGEDTGESTTDTDFPGAGE